MTFLPEFHADLSRYKEKQLHCRPTRYKTPTYFTAMILRPLDQGAKILTCEIVYERL